MNWLSKVAARGRYLTWDGQTMNIKSWADFLGIPYSKFLTRLYHYGMNDPRTFSKEYHGTPTQKKFLTHAGKTMSLRGWANYLGISDATFRQRLSLWGLSDERVFMSGRITKMFTHDGQTMSAKEWSRQLDISYALFMSRVQKFGPNDPMTFQKKVFAFDGLTMTATEWAEYLNIPLFVFKTRLQDLGADDPRVFQKRSRPFVTPSPAEPPNVITHDGMTKSRWQWAKYLGISYMTFMKRLSRLGPNDPRVFTPGDAKARMLTHDGRTMSVTQWAKELGIPWSMFNGRLKAWGENDPRLWASGSEHVNRVNLTFQGKTMSLPEWAKELGISYEALKSRYVRLGPADPRVFRPGLQPPFGHPPKDNIREP